jgi:hypothetical protein
MRRAHLSLWVVLVTVCGCQQPGPTLPDLKITPELCDRVRVGMTRSEVRAAIGGPPGFYEGTVGISTDGGPTPRKDDESWIGRRGEVVQYGRDGKATSVSWHPAKQVW